MIPFQWDGEAMRPLRPKLVRFETGATYWLEEASERSWISHAHQFAWLKTAWENLPEALSGAYPTPEHLRKRALIDTGWFNERVIDCVTEEGAERVAAFARGEDPFAFVLVDGPFVIVRKAKSQAMRGTERMSRADFQASKDAIMVHIAGLIGVDADALESAA